MPVDVRVIPLISGLSVSFTGGAVALESLRTAILGTMQTANAYDDQRAVYGWAIRGDLRALFKGAPVPQEPMLAGDAFLRLPDQEKKLLPLRAILEAAPYASVSRDMLPILEPYLTSDLPQRRLEGWCALLCLCALNRA